MENQPSSNFSEHDKDRKDTGDRIVVYGDVGPGANIGRGSVNADYIAGGDININGAVVNNRGDFATLLTDIRSIIREAQDAGEVADDTAKQILDNLDTTTDIVKSGENPGKKKIIDRLQNIADMIDAAVDTFVGNEGSPARHLLRALPIVALLIKVATRIF